MNENVRRPMDVRWGWLRLVAGYERAGRLGTLCATAVILVLVYLELFSIVVFVGSIPPTLNASDDPFSHSPVATHRSRRVEHCVPPSCVQVNPFSGATSIVAYSIGIVCFFAWSVGGFRKDVTLHLLKSDKPAQHRRVLLWSVSAAVGFVTTLVLTTTLSSLKFLTVPGVDAGWLIFGIPYYVSKNVSLKTIGFGVGLWLVLAFTTWFFCCGCCAGCCGKSRALRRARLDVFLDLVESRTTTPHLVPLIFVFSFAMPSALVLCGTALIAPDAAIPFTPGSPASLSPLCQNFIVGELKRSAAAALPGDGGAPWEAVGWTIADTLWRAAYEPPQDVCEDWKVSAPLSEDAEDTPPSSAAPALTVLPPQWIVVRDAHLLPVGNVWVRAVRSAETEETAEAANSSNCIQLLPSLTRTNGTGIAGVLLRLNTSRCAAAVIGREGYTTLQVLVSIVSDPNNQHAPATTCEQCSRRLQVRLYSRSGGEYSVERTFSSQLESSNHLVEVITHTTVHLTSSQSWKAQTITRNTTTITWRDPQHITVVDTRSDVQTELTSRPPLHVLYYTEPPPTNATVRVPFQIRVQLMTEDGLPVAGEAVQALVLAPAGSRARLDPSSLQSFTDAEGRATLHLVFLAGASANCSIVLSTASVIAGLHSVASGDLLDAVRALSDLASIDAGGEQGGGDDFNATEFLRSHLLAQFKADTYKLAQRAELCLPLPPARRNACLATAAQPTAAAAFPPEPPNSSSSSAAAALLSETFAEIGELLSDSHSRLSSWHDLFTLYRAVLPKILRALPLPPPATIQLTNQLADAVLLSAPFSGYGLSTSSWTTNLYSSMSSCVLDGYPRYVPSASTPAGQPDPLLYPCRLLPPLLHTPLTSASPSPPPPQATSQSPSSIQTCRPCGVQRRTRGTCRWSSHTQYVPPRTPQLLSSSCAVSWPCARAPECSCARPARPPVSTSSLHRLYLRAPSPPTVQFPQFCDRQLSGGARAAAVP